MGTRGLLYAWKLKSEGVILPEERLPAGQTIIVSLQHVVAMFGATVLAPILMGFNPNVVVLFSGIGTLIFLLLLAVAFQAIWVPVFPSSQPLSLLRPIVDRVLIPISPSRSAGSLLQGCFTR